MDAFSPFAIVIIYRIENFSFVYIPYILGYAKTGLDSKYNLIVLDIILFILVTFHFYQALKS